MYRPVRPVRYCTAFSYFLLARLKLRLNQPNGPFLARPSLRGLSKVAHSAGVKISATSTDSVMAETMVMENCR